MNEIPPEAVAAYAVIDSLHGQVLATANEIAQISFHIFVETGLMVLEDGRMMKSAYVRDIEQKAKGAVKVKLTKLSICPCGFHVLADHITLGTEYEIVPTMKEPLRFICGGCGKEYPGTEAVYVCGRGNSQGGYLPACIFSDDQTAFSA